MTTVHAPDSRADAQRACMTAVEAKQAVQDQQAFLLQLLVCTLATAIPSEHLQASAAVHAATHIALQVQASAQAACEPTCPRQLLLGLMGMELHGPPFRRSRPASRKSYGERA
jgi:hypothetical protein